MEIWKKIPGHPKYAASDLGRIKSFKPINRHAKPNANGRILQGNVSTFNGILYSRVTIDGKPWYVHRLVLLTFIGVLPKGKVSRHKNNESLDNALTNLTYSTQSKNMLDKKKPGGKWQGGENHNLAKLTESQVKEIRFAYGTGIYTQRELAVEFEISENVIWQIIHNKLWRHVQ